jgi:MFS family permease
MRLSRELWLVQAGVLLNTLGWGAVLPFEVIYLHDGRGLSLGLAGLAAGCLTGVAVLAAPPAGPLIDRWGARAVAAGGGVALAAGYAGLAAAHSAPAALVAAAVGGAGNGALTPAQSALLADLAPPEARHRAVAVSRVATNAGFGLGGALGGLLAAAGLPGLVALLELNAATYLVYVAVLLAVVRASPRPAVPAGGYRQVLRDRAFRRLAAANTAIIAVGWGVLPWVVPSYARHQLGAGPHLIGLMMLANAATVVVAQVPVARFAEGRRRTAMMAAGAGLIGAAYLLVPLGPGAVVAAAVVIALGECCHTSALMPLVADLAPPGLRGRYLAATGLSWWIGLALAPTLGTPALGVSPALTFAACTATAAAAAAGLLRLDARLPEAARLTPMASRA